MRRFTTLALLCLFVTPATAATIWDESVNGDLSSNAAAPTPVTFAMGSNTIIGTLSSAGGIDRDYITFTIPADVKLSAIHVLSQSPSNLAFTAVNAGATSFVPSSTTIGSFLAGYHISAADIGSNVLDRYVDSSVTTNSLPAPELGPGTYCFMSQQTNAINQTYSLEFVTSSTVGVDGPATAVLSLRGMTPNPTRGTPSIAFTLDRSGDAQLELFDLAGRRVWGQTLNGLTAGPHTTRIDNSVALSPGLYIIRLTQGDRSLTARGLVIR